MHDYAAFIVIVFFCLIIGLISLLLNFLFERKKKVSDPENQEPVTVWNHDAMDMRQDFLNTLGRNVAKRSVDLAEKDQKDKIRKEINTGHVKRAIEQVLLEEVDERYKNKSS